jgi:protein-S-isoprenylcysteine O-methyltransferase Ste14
VAPPPAIFAVALGAGLGLNAVLRGFAASPAMLWIGVALLVAGGGLAAWSFASFRRARTPFMFSPAERLMTTGPFALSRNPLYVALALTCAGIALVAGAPWALVTVFAAVVVIDRGVVAREERYLEGRFGQEYAAYKRRTRRWL